MSVLIFNCLNDASDLVDVDDGDSCSSYDDEINYEECLSPDSLFPILDTSTEFADDSEDSMSSTKWKLSDLFSDFGNKSRFIVDGEALIAEVLHDADVDASFGGQTLHLCCLFERFLFELAHRDTNFVVTFFDDDIYNNMVYQNASVSFALNRAAVILHMMTINLPECVSVRIVRDGWWGEDWRRVIGETLPSFILTSQPDEDYAHMPHTVATNLFIPWCIRFGLSVVLIEGLDTTSTRVTGLIHIAPDHHISPEGNLQAELKTKIRVESLALNTSDVDCSGILSSSIVDITIAALKRVVRCQSVSLPMASMYLQSVMTRVSLTVDERMVAITPHNGPSKSINNIWSSFINALLPSLIEELGFRGAHLNGKSVYEATIHTHGKVDYCVAASDIFDGRFFYAYLLYVMSHSYENLLSILDNETVAISWSKVTNVPLRDSIPESWTQQLWAVTEWNLIDSSARDHTMDPFSPCQQPTVSSFPFFEEAIGDLVCDVAREYQTICCKTDSDSNHIDEHLSDYLEHHFHSTKLLLDPPFSGGFVKETSDDVVVNANENIKSVVGKSNREATKRGSENNKRQKEARAIATQMCSILAGSPVKSMMIVSSSNKAVELGSGSASSRGIVSEETKIPTKNSGRSSGKRGCGLKAKQSAERKQKILKEIRVNKEAKDTEADKERWDKGAVKNISDLCPAAQVYAISESLTNANDGSTILLYIRHLLQANFPLSSKEWRRMINAAERIALLDLSNAISFIKSQRESSNGDYTSSLPILSTSLLAQLTYYAPNLVRREGTMDIRKRVPFPLDEWQHRLINVVDEKTSALVIAPTSSGKTFISYYAMERVLRESDDGVIVFLAPTKALVNQVAVEVDARFTKQYRHPGRTVCGQFTRDYRRNLDSCQILVTVPECLDILLSSGAIEHVGWSKRLQWIIADEVHMIGSMERGCVLERLLILIDCPFLALSATLANAPNFHQWLEKIEQIKGRSIVQMIIHDRRHNDLETLVAKIDSCVVIERLHPIWAVVSNSNTHLLSLSQLRFLPEQCISMSRLLTTVIGDDVTAENFFANSKPEKAYALTMDDAYAWEAALKERLTLLCRETYESITSAVQPLCAPVDDAFLSWTGTSFHHLQKNAGALLMSLKESGRLPALVFHVNSRSGVEMIAFEMLGYLISLERAERDPKKVRKSLQEIVKRKKEVLELYKKALKSDCRMVKGVPTICTTSVAADWLRELDKLHSKAVRLISPLPIGCVSSSPPSEGELIEMLRVGWDSSLYDRRNPLHAMLRRGIGVHHSGFPRKYRVVVETLFRMKKLAVVVCTSTLAYGLNMPCKTVVIAGDSFYLNAMLYHQMSGRSGRRGFDNRGDVIFYGVPAGKVRRLLLSPLPDLQWNLPITCSSLLRIIIKASILGRDRWQGVAKGLRRIVTGHMSSPRHMGNLSHAVWFCALFLHRRHFLFNNGAPTDLCGFASHLHWTEPANFAFVALLCSGQLGEIVRSGRDDVEASGATVGAATSLMTVLARLFFPVFLPRSTTRRQSLRSLHSPSELVLRPLPDSAAQVLQQEKSNVVSEATRYFSCCLRVQQRIDNDSRDNSYYLFPLSSLTGILPKTKVSVDYGIGTNWLHKIRLPSPSLRAPYEGLSGHSDSTISTVRHLVEKTRHTLHIHRMLLPAWTLDSTLNMDSYAVDAVRHGQVTTLKMDHTLDDYTLWDNLNGWKGVLTALLAAMRRRSVSGSDAVFGDTVVQQALETACQRICKVCEQVAA